MNILFSEDYGAIVNGTPSILVKGWFIDLDGRRKEAYEVVKKASSESTMSMAKNRIRKVLGE